MAWALVNIAEESKYMWVNDVWTLVDCVPGTICNLIEYDGVSPYTPISNRTLVQVPDTAQIGDTGYLP